MTDPRRTIGPWTQEELDRFGRRCLNPADAAWYVIFAPMAEKRAEIALREAMIETYLPCETVWRRHARKRDRVLRPLFMGYLFARMWPEDFHNAAAADGVLNIVGMSPGRDPSAYQIHETDVRKLQAQQENGDFDKTGPDEPIIGPGSAVKVMSGPYMGWVGKVSSMAGRDRVKVLMEAIGSGSRPPVTLPIAKVAVIC
jgi:transcriptional antiterminator RfaH